MKIDLNGMKCICGTELNYKNNNHAICVACGLVFIVINRLLAQTNVIMNGKKKEIVHIIKIFIKILYSVIWEAYYFRIFLKYEISKAIIGI